MAFALAVALVPGLAGAHGTAHEPAPAAPVAAVEAAPLYDAPAAGSYELPPIGRVVDHVLLDSHGLPARVPDLVPGQAALVSFIYANCGQGCPLALATLQRLDRELAGRPGLAERVRLVTVSFDPARDTPERMAELRGHLAPAGEWRFVTAPDEAALGPVLTDYGQRVMQRIDPEGAATGLLGHVLKVFLVDEFRQIRNVYSVGLLDTRLILNDLETVLTP